MNSQEQTFIPLQSRRQQFQRRVGVQSANGSVQSAPPIHRTVVTFGDHCAYKWIAKTNDYGEGLLLVTAAERAQQGFNWDDAITLPVLADECFDLLAVLLKCRNEARITRKRGQDQPFQRHLKCERQGARILVEVQRAKRTIPIELVDYDQARALSIVFAVCKQNLPALDAFMIRWMMG